MDLVSSEVVAKKKSLEEVVVAIVALLVYRELSVRTIPPPVNKRL
jgi:hypothetical protein